MNKTELIAAVSEKSGLSKKDAEKAVSATIVGSILRIAVKCIIIRLSVHGKIRLMESMYRS